MTSIFEGQPFSIFANTWIFQVCNLTFLPFHPKNLPKGRNFTYLEDPGIPFPWIRHVS